jgi:hypothetical protein
VTDTVAVSVSIQPCCYTRTLGYWSSHAEEAYTWVNRQGTTGIRLW